MSKDAIAEVYARALLEAVVAQGTLAAAREATEVILEAWRQEPGLQAVLTHPGIEIAEKQKLITACFGKVGDDLVLNLMGVLVAKNRADRLGAVLEAFGVACDEREGIARGEVTTALPLDSDDREALANVLAGHFGRNVVLEDNVDPSVIGGFRARVGDVVFDATVLAQLKKMAARLGTLEVSAGAWQEE